MCYVISHSLPSTFPIPRPNSYSPFSPCNRFYSFTSPSSPHPSPVVVYPLPPLSPPDTLLSCRRVQWVRVHWTQTDQTDVNDRQTGERDNKDRKVQNVMKSQQLRVDQTTWYFWAWALSLSHELSSIFQTLVIAYTQKKQKSHFLPFQLSNFATDCDTSLIHTFYTHQTFPCVKIKSPHHARIRRLRRDKSLHASCINKTLNRNLSWTLSVSVWLQKNVLH